MYLVGVVRDFSAIHALVGDVPDHEKVPHGHEYRLEWNFEVASLDRRGFSLDIALLERLALDEAEALRGVLLNELTWFAGLNTSLENLCAYLFQSLGRRLAQALAPEDRGRIATMEVKIWENDHAWAGIREGFLGP